jgi:hypothetical protein
MESSGPSRPVNRIALPLPSMERTKRPVDKGFSHQIREIGRNHLRASCRLSTAIVANAQDRSHQV